MKTGLPLVTLTYAQSLDGSIAAQPGMPLALSSPESLAFTHQLRASHDAILVGIETILADDPQLNVRYAPGASPQPIILDSRLRCPTNARFLDAVRHPIIVVAESAPLARQNELELVGATVWRLPSTQDTHAHIDLHALLERLVAEGIQTLMVEGGARVITSFLQAQLVDRIVVTIAPMLVGGVRSVTELVSNAVTRLPRLRNATMQSLGCDWVVSGELDWGNS